MQYYTFELEEDNQNLCTIITLFRKYKYTSLSMGLKCSSHIAQAVIEKFNISMQYYTFELEGDSQNLCTIITPFRKYKYASLLMGLKCSSHVAQAIMENILVGINNSDMYIDD